MTRARAVAYAADYFDSGAFLADLSRRVAFRTESQRSGPCPELRAYLEQEMVPAVCGLGAATRVLDNPEAGARPLLIAHRDEDPGLPTVLTYGHADVVLAEERRWRAGLDPWKVTTEQDRWYGRGTADNKGQHTINLAALEQVLRARGGRLGFNLKILVETAEESGSPGLREFCAEHRDELAADLLIASDGPRVAAGLPTVFLGSRGAAGFTLLVSLRDRAYHSGNWGGLLRNPATVLASAVACLVDRNGRILVPGLRPPPIPGNVRGALASIPVAGDAGDPDVDADWGEPGLSPAERMVAWNTLEVLSLAAGNPDTPVGAIPGSAHAHCQLRFVPGTDIAGLEKAVRAHLEAHGFGMVEVVPGLVMHATRTDPDDPWVRFVLGSLDRTLEEGDPGAGAASGSAGSGSGGSGSAGFGTGGSGSAGSGTGGSGSAGSGTGGSGSGGGGAVRAVLLPNLGGSLPNDAFCDELGMSTVWVPHSYPACAQHAPDEHLLAPLARQALRLMAGLFWDLGERT